jgi:hypothetical protein
MDNPDTLATLGTQGTGQINVIEYRRANPEKLATWGTQDEDKQNKNVYNKICVGHHYMQTQTA